jgi:outer membrane protein assembly factor BamB
MHKHLAWSKSNRFLNHVANTTRVLGILCILTLMGCGGRPEVLTGVSGAFRELDSKTELNPHDWPQWRGKDRCGVSTETGLLQEWPEGGPPRIWINEDAGLGYAGFAIANNRLITMGLYGEKEFGICLDANNGEELWRVEIGNRFANDWGDGPRSTPTVDGDRVYFMSALGQLSCFRIGDQSKLWSVTMDDFQGSIPQWGYAESPLVHGNQVVCTPGGELGAIVALDKLTGEKLWQTVGVLDRSQYSSIIVQEKNGQATYVQLLYSQVVGIDPDSGNARWQVDFPGKTAVIPTPVEVNGNIYVTAGYGSGSMMVEVKDNSAEELWMSRSMSNHHGGVVFIDGFLYGHGEHDGFGCQNPETGKFRWAERKQIKKGCVTYADGRFYYVQEQDGLVLLIKADSSGYEITGQFVLTPQTERRSSRGKIWVHPVVANGKLYLRDQEYIVCYDVKQ